MTQQIDLNGAIGSMLASVMLGLAEIELEYRRERQAAAIYTLNFENSVQKSSQA